ncbi:hypothetical protein GQ607_012891 [Colletotrichum asianum]|uniref:Uncharacterized protein n=1 Tax=Colletotrichum asianum TaxID=702518 RepID=A0A8H3W2F8_9PEZI|nr:hypothetical protein GQ607_012891 [Colletotrichum asianum]
MPSASPAASLPRPQPPIGPPSTSTRCRERASRGGGGWPSCRPSAHRYWLPPGPNLYRCTPACHQTPVQTVELERRLAFSIGRTCNVQTAWCAAGNGMG